ncbi:inorganic diphosphatase [Candidatus Parcubacteria bacterium]|nr:inorganic diphosphatase [Candidatus Parcubacteria bacterium]
MPNLLKILSPGSNPPEQINVVIDVAKGGSNKYEYKEEGYFKLDRVLHSPLFFPFEYGFIPQTLYDDGDCLDVVLLTTFPTFPGCLVEARPIGMLLMEDEAGIDNKIITVPLKKVDPRFEEVESIDDLGKHFKKEIELFFADYKKLEEGKYEHVKIGGWKGIEEAKKVIKKAVEKYKNENNN